MSHPSRAGWLLAGLLLVAAGLRAPVTGVAPVLSSIQAQFGLSAAQAGLLTTLPLLAFAALSPFAGGLARRHGLERTLLASLLALLAGLLLRSAGWEGTLYAGTLLIGLGIAVGNVLMPSVIKRDFPAQVAQVTSVCALVMGVSAALFSASAVPLARLWGWQTALGMMALPSLAAVFVWRAQLAHAKGQGPVGAQPQAPAVPVWSSPLAWQLTLFMGLNSTLYYAMVAWLPSVLAESGYGATAAGSVHGVMQLASALPGLVLAPLVGRFKDQKGLAAGTSLLMAVGLLGLWRWPGLATVWAFCFGAGSGACLILALMFMGLRSSTPAQAAALSGMAQCLGYLLAATGPMAAGEAHAWAGNWDLPLGAGMGLALLMAAFGMLAGRARVIGQSPVIGART
ncbi:MFS transporter [Bordetella trematum]|uniref:MFS transporter n=1 Tax=Bordetella trematum TaxID=123899 RepID=UPI000D839098|nr:MFS transporter [Bordetella trematum]SPU51114.1 cyanate transporter [Bordetella trematum]VDH07373.1 Inner membrane transport protein YeaN [Bordetella trematum]